MSLKTLILFLFILAALGACATGPKVVDEGDPWLVDRDDFLRYAKLVGLADVYLPGGMQDPEPIKQNFSDLLETGLRKAGYTVIRPQKYKTNWERAVADIGGIEDTLGVGHDPRKIAQAMMRTLEELDAGFELDAVLVPRIVVTEAPFARGVAAWDGTRQPIKSGGAMKNFWAGSPEGTLGALSLNVTLVSPHGSTYLVKSGGIEVLNKLDGKEFVLVPRAELFTDQERIEESVKIVLEPLRK
jgi:hypothetical protein